MYNDLVCNTPQFRRDSEGKKKQLLAMIERGEPKPRQDTTLGSAWKTYVGPRSKVYDAEFVKKARDLCHEHGNDWFKYADKRDPKGKKQKLLEMIKEKKNKPKKGEPLAEAWKDYVSPSNGNYDQQFVSEAKQLCQQHETTWF
jgi:hypothetical protein